MKYLLLCLALCSLLCSGASEIICSNGFTMVNGKCLGLVRMLMDYNEAESFCRLTNGAFVAQPKSLQEHNDLVHYLSDKSVYNVWLGLRCTDYNEANCQWDDTTMLGGFGRFGPSSPDGRDSCIKLAAYPNGPGIWESNRCDVKMATVCELPPTERDCQAHCGINFNNYCYTIYDQQKSFNDSEAYCQLQQKSHLVSIHSYQEWRMVSESFRREGKYWIGGTVDANTKISWVDGTTGAYSLDTYSDGGACLQFGVDQTYRGTYYYGKSCGEQAVFMCKRPAKC